MRNLLSKREYGKPLPRPRLNAVWYVEADESYCVNGWTHQDESCIAVRTLTGAGRLELTSGEIHLLPADSLGIFDARQVMNYSAEKDGWQFYWFEFTTDSASALPLGTAQIRMSAQERIELERCFQSLSRNSACECLMAESLFCYLMADWQLRITESNRSGMPIRDILALLERGRRERMSISELAHKAGMCERSFRSAVHEATGMSPKAYMLKGEMAAAMELLRTTGMTVSEIASLFNYSSPFYFSRVFRRHYGVSPQQVRGGIKL